MAVYTTFKDEYGMGIEATWGTGVAVTTPIVTGRPVKLPLTNHPDFTSGMDIIHSPKALGFPWRRTEEYYQGIKSPGATLELDFDVNTMAPFLYCLFNGMAEGDNTPYTKTYNVYQDVDGTVTAPDYALKSNVLLTPLSLSLVRNTGVASQGFRLVGSTVRSITISSSEGEAMKASIEVIARDLETDFNGMTGSPYTLSTTNSTVLLHQNLGFDIDDSDAGVTLNSFSITLTNNMVTKHQANITVLPADAPIANQFIVGPWEVTGNASFTWDGNNATIIDKYIAGTDIKLEIFNPGSGTYENKGGESDTAGDFYLTCNVHLTAAPLEGDDEQTLNISFDGVDDGTNDVTRITLADGVNYAWPPG